MNLDTKLLQQESGFASLGVSDLSTFLRCSVEESPLVQSASDSINTRFSYT